MTEDEANRIFVTDCIQSKDWNPVCSTIVREYQDRDWLISGMDKIFFDQLPDRKLVNPLPKKISTLAPDCLNYPTACQAALLNSCAKTPIQGNQEGGVASLCACFSPNNSSNQSCNCRGSVPNYNSPPCFGTVCTIKDVNLILYGSEMKNVQLFQQCGSNSYLAQSNCTIYNVNVLTNGSTVGNLLLKQICLGSSDIEHVTDVQSSTDSFIESTIIPGFSWFVVVLLLALTFFSLFLASLFLYRKETVPKTEYVIAGRVKK